MSPKRLTRKEIKEDRIQTVLADFYDGLARNTRLLGAAAIALVLIFGASYAWQTYSRDKNDQMQLQFAEALKIYHAPLESDVATAEEKPELTFNTAEERRQKALEAFNAVAQEQKGAQVALFSRYYAALIQHEMGEPEKAESDLKALISDSSDSQVTALARNQLAQLSLASGKTAQAIEIWKNMLDSSPANFPLENILLSLAQAYDETGEKEEALKHYRRIIAEYPQNPNARELQSRIDVLDAQLAAEKTPESDTPPQDSGA